eukprot:scaffold403971_cov27-Prasinocladus_malaysianus.AAC.1
MRRPLLLSVCTAEAPSSVQWEASGRSEAADDVRGTGQTAGKGSSGKIPRSYPYFHPFIIGTVHSGLRRHAVVSRSSQAHAEHSHEVSLIQTRIKFDSSGTQYATYRTVATTRTTTRTRTTI